MLGGIGNMLFSTCSQTSKWVRSSAYFLCLLHSLSVIVATRKMDTINLRSSVVQCLFPGDCEMEFRGCCDVGAIQPTQLRGSVPQVFVLCGRFAVFSSSAAALREENGPSPKRPKVHVAQEMKECFVAWAGMNLRATGMNMIDSLRRAQFLWPHIFGSIHDDTPRRWKVKMPESGAGRLAAIHPGLFTELAQITSTKCSKVGLSADTFLIIWKEYVKALLKRDLDISVHTVRRCMHKMGHTPDGNAERLSFTKAQVHATRELLAQKIGFLMVERGVTDLARVWNPDETSCRVFPASEYGLKDYASASGLQHCRHAASMFGMGFRRVARHVCSW